jgi:hypothetical protein
MYTEYFDLTNCDYKDTCSRTKSHACNRCIRNKMPMTDNFIFKTYNAFDTYKSSPCDNCCCNPKNGGSGICNCTLNLPEIR